MTSHVINTVEESTSTAVAVSINRIAFFTFYDNQFSESYSDTYFVDDNTAIGDGFDGSSDFIQIRPTAPSSPDTERLNLDRVNSTDDDFIDVDISVP